MFLQSCGYAQPTTMIEQLIRAFYRLAPVRRFVSRLILRIPSKCFSRSFLVSHLSQLVDQTANDRAIFLATSFSRRVTRIPPDADYPRVRYLPGVSNTVDEDARRERLLKKLPPRGRGFFRELSPRLEKKKAYHGLMDTSRGSIDRPIVVPAREAPALSLLVSYCAPIQSRRT